VLLDNGKAPRRIAVVCHLANTQMVIVENFETAFLLNAVVFALRTPAHYGLFVAPSR